SYPTDGPAVHDPVMVAVFDQRVEPAAVLAALELRAGPATLTIRPATTAEVQADSEASRMVAAASPGYAVAFRAVAELPADEKVTVSVPPGTPSAEGPRRTEAAQGWTFHTYGPFRVRRSRCLARGDECPPNAPWVIELTNPVDERFFD